MLAEEQPPKQSCDEWRDTHEYQRIRHRGTHHCQNEQKRSRGKEDTGQYTGKPYGSDMCNGLVAMSNGQKHANKRGHK